MVEHAKDGSQAEGPAGLLSVIIPAHDEAGYIGACLQALLAQDAAAGAVEVIVAANGCSDATVVIARDHAAEFAARGWRLKVLDLPEGGKPAALDAADAVAGGGLRMYLDADVHCDPPLLGQLRAALAVDVPRYATGRLQLAPARSWVSRRYGAFWCELPFVRGGAVGAGLYAVNPAGRARWGRFPRIIADDSYARLQFAPAERVEVEASYHWPLVEGFTALVRVRRRQDAGMAELLRLYPELAANEAKPTLTAGWLLGALWRKPLSGVVYIAVSLAVRSRRATAEWTRGR